MYSFLNLSLDFCAISYHRWLPKWIVFHWNFFLSSHPFLSNVEKAISDMVNQLFDMNKFNNKESNTQFSNVSDGYEKFHAIDILLNIKKKKLPQIPEK
ncbi:hypothetical protein BpHYR1_046829 [Brachionus plicatilis]|uniref:Uncharacterized protein n=1 Tax=Brachionus plicatilis TaxID=10195 RepID=A0A3M7S103_BRAPC|nr:hypothetical protein BpHYR1_046829 [Brachionus plicatilis]